MCHGYQSLLHLLGRKYGNPYAHVSGLLSIISPTVSFNGWGSKTRRIISFDEWTRTFYNSLTFSDQKIVRADWAAAVCMAQERPLCCVMQEGRCF